MISLNQGNPLKLFNQLKNMTPPVFHIFFDYEISHTDLINHFKGLMNEMAPRPSIEGKSLSEVLFTYINFDPFSRRQGTEVSQTYFTNEVRNSLQNMRNTKVETDLVSLQDKILELMNGLIKSSCKFDLKALSDISAEISEEANTIDPSDKFRKAIFDDLIKYSNQIDSTQAKTYKDVKDVKDVKDLETSLLNKIESVLVNLILFSYQPHFKESHLESYKLRALEICNLLYMLYHYSKTDYNMIFTRVRNIQQLIFGSTRSFEGVKFDDIDNNNADEFNRRIELIVDEQSDILRLIIPNNQIQRREKLNNLRMKVEEKELEIQISKKEKNN